MLRWPIQLKSSCDTVLHKAVQKLCVFFLIRVSDAHFFADPDPSKNLHADPDPDPGGIRGRGLGVKGKN